MDAQDIRDMDIYEFMDVCRDYGYDGYVDDWIDGENLGAVELDDEIEEFLRYNNWTDLRDVLSTLPDYEPYEMYRQEGLQFIRIDSYELDDLKEQLISDMIDNGDLVIEEDDEDDDYENPFNESSPEYKKIDREDLMSLMEA